MCGVAGIYAYREGSRSLDSDELLRIRDHMFNRGPDGAGLWIDRNRRVGLAHRRLAIIDLSEAGAQPMASADGRYTITFNGEIYNYRKLRAELERDGFVFRSQSDTEVLLHLYARYGESMVRHLRGMYAFAIWDDVRQALFLARDPFGIKPLYYFDDGKTFRFASQVRALLAGNAFIAKPESAGQVGFLLWGFVPEPFTLYEGLMALPAGTFMWIDRSGVRAPSVFFDIIQTFAEAERKPAHLSTQESRHVLRDAVLDSVTHHLVADVPVGVFLSAGIDSTTLTALASESHPRVRTFTLGFVEYRGTGFDEVPVAEAVARRFGTQHTTTWVSKKEFQDDFDAVFAAMDQPSIDGVNSYFVSKAAAAAGMKVAISGLGGDELFGGYPSFKNVPALANLGRILPISQGAGKVMRVAAAPFFRGTLSPKYAGLFEYGTTYGRAYLLRRSLYMPWELDEFINPSLLQEGFEKLRTTQQLDATVADVRLPRLKVASLELAWYTRSQLLRDVDWASMAHSLEVRVPLLDVDLLRAVAPLMAAPSPITKRDLARTPGCPLPESVLMRKKSGFSIPVRDWLVAVNGNARLPPRGLRGWAQFVIRTQPIEKVRRALSAPAKIVFRIGQLGDTVVSLPAIAELRRTCPNHHLILLTDRHRSKSTYVSSWDVIEPTGLMDEVIFYDAKEGVLRNVVQSIGIARYLRHRHPEVLVALLPHRSTIQRVRDWLVLRVLFQIPSIQGNLSADARPRVSPPLPIMEPEWRRLLRVVDAQSNGLQGHSFRMPVKQLSRDRIQGILADNCVLEQFPILAVGAGSKMPAKRWPAAHFVDALRRARESIPDLQFVFLGSDQEYEYCQSICEQVGRGTTNLAGKLRVAESAAMLERCVAYLGNDTGTMHLAASVGTPCVAIFSARDFPGLWDPWGKGHRIIRRQAACAGCMLEICKYANRCTTLITAEEVVHELMEMLSAEGARGRA